MEFLYEEESIEESKAKIESLMKKFEDIMLQCRRLQGEANGVFDELFNFESKFNLWLLQQDDFEYYEEYCLPHHQKCEEFIKNAKKKLEIQRKILESDKPKSLKSSSRSRSETSSITVNQSNTRKCKVCLESHEIYTCDSYLSKTSKGRYAIVTKLRLCRNCLRPGHKAVNCRNEKRCKKCNQKHHTTLHFTKPSSRPTDRTETQNIKIVKSKMRSLIPVPIRDCKVQNLSTVRILIPDAKGNWQSVEAIIDTASNKNKLKQNVQKISAPKNKEYQHTTDSSYRKSHKRELSIDVKLNRVNKKHKVSIRSTSSRASQTERSLQHDLNQVKSTTSDASDKKSSSTESIKSFNSIVQSRGQSPVTLNRIIKQY